MPLPRENGNIYVFQGISSCIYAFIPRQFDVVVSQPDFPRIA